jgi:hypothetical protein
VVRSRNVSTDDRRPDAGVTRAGEARTGEGS